MGHSTKKDKQIFSSCSNNVRPVYKQRHRNSCAFVALRYLHKHLYKFLQSPVVAFILMPVMHVSGAIHITTIFNPYSNFVSLLLLFSLQMRKPRLTAKCHKANKSQRQVYLTLKSLLPGDSFYPFFKENSENVPIWYSFIYCFSIILCMLLHSSTTDFFINFSFQGSIFA